MFHSNASKVTGSGRIPPDRFRRKRRISPFHAWTSSSNHNPCRVAESQSGDPGWTEKCGCDPLRMSEEAELADAVGGITDTSTHRTSDDVSILLRDQFLPPYDPGRQGASNAPTRPYRPRGRACGSGRRQRRAGSPTCPPRCDRRGCRDRDARPGFHAYSHVRPRPAAPCQ